jgi:oxygen-dependent protoporphyrinogen oxidase
MRDKNILDSDDAKLIDLALSDLRFLVKLCGAPLYARVHRWSESMPQYEVGHDVRIETIEQSSVRGLHLCGAYLHGVGLPDCVLAGEKAAAAALAQGES